MKSEHLAIEGAGVGGVGHIEHDMADLQGFGPLVEAGARIDTVDILRRIGRRRRNLRQTCCRNDEFHGESCRIDGPHAGPFSQMAGLRQPLAHPDDIVGGFEAPGYQPDG